MKLERFKERDNKRIGIIVFTLVCVLLVSGVILYRTFAIFEVKTNQNVIKGTVQDPGDIYFAFYKDGQIQKDMPRKEEGYVLDESKSYCGVTGADDPDIKVFVTEDNMIHVSGVTTSRTKCNLYFTKGIFLMGHGVPVVTSGDGLYKIEHNGVKDTLNDSGFSKEEYRYAGANPNNYVTFNGEQWRIIGLVNVMVDEGYKVEQRVKIIRNTELGVISWDYRCTSSNSCDLLNSWSTSSLNAILNDKYFQAGPVTFYYAEYGNNVAKNTTIDFTNNYITNPYSMMIDEVYWNLGGPYGNFGDNVDSIYQSERGFITYDVNPIFWKGKIALPYLSDGKYANQSSKLWLASPGTWYWTLTQEANVYNSVVTMYFNSNEFKVNADSPRYSHSVVPTLYLKPDVKIISGTGSLNDAFEIAQVLK